MSKELRYDFVSFIGISLSCQLRFQLSSNAIMGDDIWAYGYDPETKV